MIAVTSLLSALALWYCSTEMVFSEDSPCENLTNNTCTSCVGEEMLLQCPAGQIVTGFLLAGFGKDSGTNAVCGYQSTDCVGKPALLNGYFMSCMWKRRVCRFTLTPYDFTIGFLCPTVQSTPKYLMTSHLKCVSELSLHRLCREEHQVISINHNNSGYIVSPDFPKPYSQTRSNPWGEGCTISLAAAQGMGIHLQSIYMDIRSTGNNCQDDYIQLNWTDQGKSRDMTHCGTDPMNISIMASHAVLTFHFPHSGNSNEGFALHYSSFEISSKTTVSEIPEATTITKKTITDDSTAKNNVEDPMENSNEDPEKDYSTIIAIVLSIAVGILLILLCIAVLMICQKRKSMYSPEEETSKRGHSAFSDCHSEFSEWSEHGEA